jgi:hypothetical protein
MAFEGLLTLEAIRGFFEAFCGAASSFHLNFHDELPLCL